MIVNDNLRSAVSDEKATVVRAPLCHFVVIGGDNLEVFRGDAVGQSEGFLNGLTCHGKPTPDGLAGDTTCWEDRKLASEGLVALQDGIEAVCADKDRPGDDVMLSLG